MYIAPYPQQARVQPNFTRYAVFGLAANNEAHMQEDWDLGSGWTKLKHRCKDQIKASGIPHPNPIFQGTPIISILQLIPIKSIFILVNSEGHEVGDLPVRVNGVGVIVAGTDQDAFMESLYLKKPINTQFLQEIQEEYT